MGYRPLCLLYGNEELWRMRSETSYILDLMRRQEVRTEFVNPKTSFRASTIMQTCRLFASALSDLSDDDYLLTTDVDMLPLDRDFLNRQDSSKAFHIFSADAYSNIAHGALPPKFPMCYIGASVQAWRSILDLRGESLDVALARSFEGRSDDWDNDEMYFASRLFRHPFFEGPIQKNGTDWQKGQCQLIARTWPGGLAYRRIDRAAWSFDGKDGMIDCHCYRPGYNDTGTLLKILCRYFPSDTLFFEDYIHAFMKLKKGE